MGLQPYSKPFIKALGIGVIVFALNYLIPQINPFPIDIIIRSAAITIVFMILIYKSEISNDINQEMDKWISKFKLKMK